MPYKIIDSLKSLLIDIDAVKPDPRNARQHPARNIDTIKRSLEAYGQRKPIVVNSKTGHIEAGNGMWEAAKALKWDKIAAVQVEDDAEVAQAFGIMDNQSALLAEWDLPTLKDILQELDDGSVDMDLTGFNATEIEELMTQFHTPEEGLTDDDAIPEEVETVCKTGDLWILGEHRLLCGDATKKEDVEKLMQGEKADMVFTDPPYALMGNATGVGGIADDKMVRPFFAIVARHYAVSCHTFAELYTCCDWHSFSVVQDEYTKNHWTPKNVIVWDKMSVGLGSAYRMRHEFLLYAIRASHNTGMTTGKVGSKRHITDENLWQIPRERDGGHNAQKPVALCARAISNSSAGGGGVLDFFGGSGSTLIACEKLGRKCRMMEIDEHYCDVIIQRWQNFTGKQAELINGKT